MRRDIPSWLYHAAQKLRFAFSGRPSNPGKPPRHLSFVYGYDADFRHVGEDFARIVIDLCRLPRDGKVLDIGSGIGRIALPLTTYLDSRGEYHGVDIRKDGVTWCKKNITASHPHFHFHHIKLANATYAPLGRGNPATFEFPFSRDYFDALFTKSVFTHMDLQEIAQYLRESFRMLKPGGLCLHTFFLLNDTSRAGQREGRSQFQFVHPAKGGLSISRREPEKAIAFEEPVIRKLYEDAGLELLPPIRYGSWSGRPDGLSGQDIVVARKP